MIESLPTWIELLFILSFFYTIILFHLSNSKPNKLTALIVLWSIGHSILAYIGFYEDVTAMPPRFGLVLTPSLGFIVYGMLAKQQAWVLKWRNTNMSTFLHFVRLPVEIVLFGLFTYKMIPELMTFEGWNYDIIMGVTAPIIGLLLLKNKIRLKALLVWNSIGLVLILIILINGVLSSELPFQQFAFEQPNRGVNYFPFILLPATIVPIVIWTHLSDIIKLVREIKLA